MAYNPAGAFRSLGGLSPAPAPPSMSAAGMSMFSGGAPFPFPMAGPGQDQEEVNLYGPSRRKGPPAGPLPAKPAGGGPAPAPAPNLSNITGRDENLDYLTAEYKKRLGQEPTQRAMDRAASEIRDTASGLQKELGESIARRGFSAGTSGVEDELRTRLAEGAQRAIGKSSADISLGREKDLDALVMGGAGLMRAPSELALARQGLGLRQWESQNAAEIAREQADIARQNAGIQQQTAMADLWTKYLSLFM